jgi:MYXO-CTERM domain-containing protein
VAVLAIAAVAALTAVVAPARAQTAKSGIVTTSLWLPEGVTKMRGVLAFTGVGLGSGWPNDAEFRALAKRLELGVITVRGEKSSGDDASYPVRCMRGEFKMLLDSLTELGKVSNHPELANVPIIGGGHSHGGDYWNYFNACYPERMALVFCKSSGGVQYTKGALRTPMIWEIGTNDLLNNSQGAFRGGMFAHRSKGSPLTLVLGPGEGHNNLTGGAKQMVIEVMEAIFKLRVPAGADATAGPVTLLDIDEASGQYWLGDNYSREIGAYASFPGKMSLFKTSFLPSEALAQKWKAFVPALPASIQVDDGFCSKCYRQLADEAPLKPLVTGTPSATSPAPDAGGSPPVEPDAAPTAPPTDAAPPVTEVKPDAATSAPAPTPPGPSMPRPSPAPEPVDNTRQPPSKAYGGCMVGGGSPPAIALLLTLVALPLLRRRRP